MRKQLLGVTGHEIRANISRIRQRRMRLFVLAEQLAWRNNPAVERSLKTALTCLVYVWALPTTAVGLLFVLPTLLTGGRGKNVEGVLELHGGIVRWMLTHLVPLPGGVSALTLGHVVLARDEECHERTRIHERVHVRQAERWGLFFLPAYLSCSAWMLLRGKHPYRDNPFEVEAFRLEAEHKQTRIPE